MRRHAKGCLTAILKFFLICTVIVVLFNVTFRVIFVDGESMLPTLQSGDWIAACRLVEPKRGDIIVTNTDNAYHARLIKRLIAVAGDTVDIDFDTGVVTVNGEALEEPYLQDGKCVRGTVDFPLTVPEGKVFLLGDNRTNSVDSRYEEIGCVDADSIIGPVVLRLLPMPFTIITNPD